MNTAYKRAVTKEANEEGKYRRLIKELEDMGQQYGVHFDTILELFESCCCNKKELRANLEKKSYTVWTKLDDIAVKMPPESPEW